MIPERAISATSGGGNFFALKCAMSSWKEWPSHLFLVAWTQEIAFLLSYYRFSAFNILSPVLECMKTSFLTLIGFLCCNFWRFAFMCRLMSCFWNLLESTFLFVDWCVCWTVVGALSSIIPIILRGRSVVIEWIQFNFCPCVIVCGIRLLAHIAHCYVWYCIMNGYCETKVI